MKFLIIIPMILAMIMSGCESSRAPSNLKAAEIVAKIEESGMNLKEVECSDMKIFHKKPVCFKTNENSAMYFYEYKNDSIPHLALQSFLDENKDKNIIIPQAYEVRNILFLYYSSESRTDPFANRDKKLLEIAAQFHIE